jgi:hypothetical protein
VRRVYFRELDIDWRIFLLIGSGIGAAELFIKGIKLTSDNIIKVSF